MKYLYLLIIGILFHSFNVNCQNLNFDTISIKSNQQNVSWTHVTKKLDLPEIQNSQKQFELRMFCKNALTNSGYFNIVFYADSEFKGIKGEFRVVFSKDFKKIKRVSINKKEKYVVQNSNRFLDELLNHNITNLPNQNEIKDKMKIVSTDENGDEVVKMHMVCDGSSYDFELKVNENVRFMNYSNPCTYLEHYKHVIELQNICGVIKTMNNE